MGPITTYAGRGRASRQAHLAQESQWPWATGREEPDDHGSTAGGGWRDKSETARPAHSQPAPPLLTVSPRPNRTKHTPNREQTMNSQHDHGSAAVGAWRDKSEIPGPIARRS